MIYSYTFWQTEGCLTHSKGTEIEQRLIKAKTFAEKRNKTWKKR